MAKNTFGFAHLFSLGPKPKASEDEDDKKSKKAKGKGRAEKDDREDDDTDAEEDEKDPDAEEDDDGTDAEEDDDDTDAEEDDDDPDDEEDDDKEREDDGDAKKSGKATRQARQFERRRCARILSSKFAAANIGLAATLAFNTGMSSAEAVKVLKSHHRPQSKGQKNQSQRRSLDDRMRAEHQARLNPDSGSRAAGKSGLVSKMTSLYDGAVKGNK